MTGQYALPEGFRELEQFVPTWVVSRSCDRATRRLDSSEEERVAFFNAARDLAAPALELLDKKPLSQLDEREQRLMDLMLSLVHVALAVEIQGDDEPRHARGARHVIITRASSDGPAS